MSKQQKKSMIKSIPAKTARAIIIIGLSR